ncbi:hypothetical protein HYU19_04590 [Candidatus Woesearchaeota archaeon]|nr:hypothetical protein [Candidatus Woesearchaeota archaeon]
MAINAGRKAVHRFGPRYGRTVKDNYASIEMQQKKLYPCPYCAKESVRRVVLGIWQCQKCQAKFTGKAYTVTKKREASLAKEPVVVEEQDEMEEEQELSA